MLKDDRALSALYGRIGTADVIHNINRHYQTLKQGRIYCYSVQERFNHCKMLIFSPHFKMSDAVIANETKSIYITIKKLVVKCVCMHL